MNLAYFYVGYDRLCSHWGYLMLCRLLNLYGVAIVWWYLVLGFYEFGQHVGRLWKIARVVVRYTCSTVLTSSGT